MNYRSKFIGAFVITALTIGGATDAFAQKGKKKGKSKEAATLELKNEIDSVSYGVGLNIALGMKKDFEEANIEAMAAGLIDGMTKDSTILTPEQMNGIVMAYFKAKNDAKEKERMEKFKEIAKEGVAFMEENKTKEGVKTTESGLQYIVLKEGAGKQPGPTSSVTVHYHGTTPKGEVFDSSVNRGKPATFGLNQVIKGWTEGLQLMKEGAKFKFFIPQELAYGSRPPQNGEGLIKKFMPLVFEVELITVNE